MKGIILTGGAGTRLRPLTHTGPKQLIPIANKPNVLYCLEDLRDAEITDIGVILGDNQPGKVRELLGDGSKWGVHITYIVKGGIRGMVDEFQTKGYDAEVMLCRVPNPEKFGVAELDAQGHIVSLVEKPKAPKSELALVGIYLLRKNIFPIIKAQKPSWRNELEITEALDELRKQGGRIRAAIVKGWWKDTGKPEDILEANHLLLDDVERRIDGTVEEGAAVEGRVRIGEGTVIATGSVVKGPVVIGRDCIIGPRTYVGPYTSIGDGSRLVGADIEASIVIGDALIEGPDKIVNSLIGRSVTIRSAGNRLPKGHRLIVGENSTLDL